MLENKQTVAFPKAEAKELELGNTKVKVKPYLSALEQGVLSELFLKEFFRIEDPLRVFNAERALLAGLIQYCTDIKIVDKDENQLFTIDDLYENFEFVKRFRKLISNYDEFRALLRMTIDEINHERKLDESLGRSLKVIVAQLTNFLNEFDSSPESVERLKGLIQEADQSEILKILSEKLK